MALRDYPIKFDDTVLPFFPTSWQRTPQKIQNTNQSEGGTDIVQQIRKGKLNIQASFALADVTWIKFFEEYNDKDDFVLSEYSPLKGDYDTHTVRMEGLTNTPRRKSEELTAVTGVWDVSFTLEEF